jgi:hypothetical protein
MEVLPLELLQRLDVKMSWNANVCERAHQRHINALTACNE